MTYWTKDGVRLEGSTPRQVMLSLRRNARLKSRDLDAYMEKCARFAGYRAGRVIKAADAAELLSELLKVKLIIEREG